VSKEGIIKSKQLADKHNIHFHMHLSETRKEVYDCYKKHKMRPVEYLENLNVLDKNCIFAHCGYLTKREIYLLKQYNCSAISCTTSNMKLGTGGYFSYPEFRDLGVQVALGTDGPCSNNSLNMFLEMEFFTLMQKWFRWQSNIISAKEVFKLCSECAYKILGLNGGKICENYLADIVLIDIDDIPKPITNIFSNLVYSFEGYISDVIINGNFVLRDKKLDEEDKIIDNFLTTYRKYF